MVLHVLTIPLVVPPVAVPRAAVSAGWQGAKAEPERTIGFAHEAEACSTGETPRRLEPVAAGPAAIQVTAPPAPAWFFSMH